MIRNTELTPEELKKMAGFEKLTIEEAQVVARQLNDLAKVIAEVCVKVEVNK
jgi:hypothetical protein